MTDKQIRDRIVGALSVSMMPMEIESECIAFLDRCLRENRWHDAENDLPPMHTEVFEDDKESFDFEVSNAVLVCTKDRKMVVAKCCFDECGKPWWFDEDGTDCKAVRWKELPEVPGEVDG